MNVFGELGCTALTTLLSLCTLFLLAKLIGNRQMSQLSLFDYINGITIGSIAAELATDLENWYKTLVALVIYGLITFIVALLTDKSVVLRRVIEGHSYILYDKGMLYKKNLSKCHMDIDEFLTLCRCKGYFDLQEVQSAILEPNGQISILPKAKYRPTIPDDFGMNPTQDFPLATVIMDGKILYRNLKTTGKNEKWLHKQLHAKNISDLNQVLLATCSMDGQLEVYKKINENPSEDIFE